MTTVTLIVAGFLLVVGLLWCFVGQRFYRLIITIGGITFGAGLASRLLAGQSDLVYYGGIILAAIIIGFIFYRYYKFQIVLIGLLLGLVVGLLVISGLKVNDSFLQVVILTVGAFVGVGLASALSNFILRLGTAFIGASMIVTSGLLFLGRGVISADGRDLTLTLSDVESLVALVVIVLISWMGYRAQMRNSANP